MKVKMQGFRKEALRHSLIRYFDHYLIKKLFIWNATTGALIKTTQPTNSNTREVHWKGNYLVTVGSYPDKPFKIWRTEVINNNLPINSN